MKLTTRDIIMLTWLTRLKCSTYDQLASLTGTSIGALRRRLPRLEEQGLVLRVDARRGDRPVALWFPTPHGAAQTKSGIIPERPDRVDTVRAFYLAEIALPYQQRGHHVLAGTEVEDLLDKAAFGYALRTPHRISEPLPSPELLIQRGHNLIAVELRLGAATVDDWHRRLLDYEHLGVHRLLLHTDSVVLKAVLASPGAYPARVFVTIELLSD